VYTSQGRLAALLNDEENNESLSNNKGQKKDNKERGKILPEGKDQRGFEKIKNPLCKHFNHLLTTVQTLTRILNQQTSHNSSSFQ